MAEPIVVANPGQSPVPLDADGHLIGGGEYRCIIPAAVAREAIAAGLLVKVDDPGKTATVVDAAKAAFAELRGHGDSDGKPGKTPRTPTIQGGASRGEG